MGIPRQVARQPGDSGAADVELSAYSTTIQPAYTTERFPKASSPTLIRHDASTLALHTSYL